MINEGAAFIQTRRVDCSVATRLANRLQAPYEDGRRPVSATKCIDNTCPLLVSDSQAPTPATEWRGFFKRPLQAERL
jgi:hypothetical protein